MEKTIQPFILPEALHAAEPPERRGIRRDQVRLMVTEKFTNAVTHDTFYNLNDYLQAGDLLLLNNSRTIPAVLYAEKIFPLNERRKGIEIRLARKISNHSWDALILSDAVHEGDRFLLQNDLQIVVEYQTEDSPLWTITFNHNEDAVMHYLYRYGEPVRYEYIKQPWDLAYYQTVFASVPGSVEMPSAGRAFSWEMLFKLQHKGIKLGFVQLHTGLSYLHDEQSLKPQMNPEYYSVSEHTLQLVQQARKSGRRVIAVGTTVVRALETALQTNRNEGMTNLYIGTDFELKGVDGILTGMHEPEASHLDMLSAFVDSKHLMVAYDQAISNGYLWHEFGDMNLII